MKMFFAGGEKGSHRSLLLASEVSRIAINVTHFAIPKRKELILSEVFPNCELLVYTSENDENVSRYDEFIREHEQSIRYVVGRPGYEGDWLGGKHIPFWSDDQDLERLAFLCQKSGRVAIPDKAINAKTLPRIRSLSQRWGASLTGLTSKPDVIDSLPWDNVVVSSWTSTIRYGETQVWDGHGLRRYPAQQKDSSRKKHRGDIIRLGINIDDIMEDNVQEVGRLAIKSWQAWEAKNLAYDPLNSSDESEFSTQEDDEVVDMSTQTSLPTSVDRAGTGIATTPALKRHDDTRVLLPVIGVERIASFGAPAQETQGESVDLAPETVPVIRHQGVLLRQCDSCYLASRCPAFTEHSECGFNLPVEIRTKDQLQSALRALLEMQVSRVLFARFAEEMEGQGLDPSLSKELDRVFDLVTKFRDISDSRELVRMEIETRSSGGVLSRLFGAKVGDSARELDGGPVTSNQLDSLAMDILDVDDA